MISIIVPVYNSETFLRDTINSILCQSFKDFELILIDDGSTDRSLEICYEYAIKDERVKVFSKENGGVSSARNLGLKNSVGDYIVFVDSDDFVDGTILYDLHRDIESTDSDIAICSYKKLTIEEYQEETSKICKNNKKIAVEIISNPIEFYYKRNEIPFICNKLYKKSVIKDIWFDETISYAEDLLYTALVVFRAKKVCFRDRIGYYYIHRDNSLSWREGTIESWFAYVRGKAIVYDTFLRGNLPANVLDGAWDDYCKAIIALYRYVVHKRLKTEYEIIKNKYNKIILKYIYESNLSFVKRIEYFSFVYSYRMACLFHKEK